MGTSSYSHEVARYADLPASAVGSHPQLDLSVHPAAVRRYVWPIQQLHSLCRLHRRRTDHTRTNAGLLPVRYLRPREDAERSISGSVGTVDGWDGNYGARDWIDHPAGPKRGGTPRSSPSRWSLWGDTAVYADEHAATTRRNQTGLIDSNHTSSSVTGTSKFQFKFVQSDDATLDAAIMRSDGWRGSF